ncbi:MAG: DUF3332 family protein [Deltaproteobacteria bacterium]|nr:DUF3332 family protein [Deltaproteobacteria bacterium]
MMAKSRFAKIVAVLLVVSVGGLASGCFGKFQLTRKMYEINQSVDDKYVRSAVTWLFVIPYVLTGTLDFCIFNLIEFWSGENPIAAGPSARVRAVGDERVAMTIGRQGGATVATVETFKAGVLLSTLTIRDDGKGIVTSELSVPGGETVRTSAATLPDGSVEVVTLSRSGSRTERHSASAVEARFARASRVASGARQALSAATGTGKLAAPARRPAFQG